MTIERWTEEKPGHEDKRKSCGEEGRSRGLGRGWGPASSAAPGCCREAGLDGGGGAKRLSGGGLS